MWQLPEVRTQVKDIDEHETDTFKVIIKKNGVKLTITPSLVQSQEKMQTPHPSSGGGSWAFLAWVASQCTRHMHALS